MTARSPRILALTITVGVALLAGVFTGIAAGASVDCGTSKSDNSENKDKDNEDRPGPVGGGEDDEDPGPFEDNEGNKTDDLPGGGGGSAPDGHQLAKGDDEECGGFSAPAAGVGFLGALLAGAAVTFLIPKPGTGAAQTSAVPAAPASPGNVGSATGSFPVLDPNRMSPPPAQPEPSRSSEERRALVDALIYVRDRATSQAIADRVRAELAAVGVQEVAPAGAVFDPAQHEAGGFTATDDPSKQGVIAAVEVVGYTDNATVVRPPVVTVYRHGN